MAVNIDALAVQCERSERVNDSASCGTRNTAQPQRCVKTDTQVTKRRAQRASRACDFCHSRSIRCRPSENDDSNRNSCQCCIEYARRCTYHRPIKKRGIKSRSQQVSIPPPYTISVQSFPTPRADFQTLVLYRDQDALEPTTRIALTEIYGEIIYPNFPIFHLPALLRRTEAQDYLGDPAFDAVSRALCALVRSRMRDGALLSEKWAALVSRSIPSSADLASAAASMIPRHADAAENFDHLRAICLLALLAIQNGKAKDVRFYLGFYQTLISVNGLTDESNWSNLLSPTQFEERRRVVWTMFKLEVFTAVCYDPSSSAFPECHDKVGYPEEFDDEALDVISRGKCMNVESGPKERQAHTYPAIRKSDTSNWIQGWNFVTDLYRVLHYAMGLQRGRDGALPRPTTGRLCGAFQNMSPVMVLSKITHLYQCLPQRLKEVRPMTFDVLEDRYSFQAMDINTTMQLVRLMMFIPGHTPYRDQSAIIEEVCYTFLQVPMGYLKAMSVPLLYQLVGMGCFLHATLTEDLSPQASERICCTLLALSFLLSRLGFEVFIGEGPADCIRKYINYTDVPMQALGRNAAIAAPTWPYHSFANDISLASSTSSAETAWEQSRSLAWCRESVLAHNELFDVPFKQENWDNFFDFVD